MLSLLLVNRYPYAHPLIIAIVRDQRRSRSVGFIASLTPSLRCGIRACFSRNRPAPPLIA